MHTTTKEIIEDLRNNSITPSEVILHIHRYNTLPNGLDMVQLITHLLDNYSDKLVESGYGKSLITFCIRYNCGYDLTLRTVKELTTKIVIYTDQDISMLFNIIKTYNSKEIIELLSNLHINNKMTMDNEKLMTLIVDGIIISYPEKTIDLLEWFMKNGLEVEKLQKVLINDSQFSKVRAFALDFLLTNYFKASLPLVNIMMLKAKRLLVKYSSREDFIEIFLEKIDRGEDVSEFLPRSINDLFIF